MANIAAEEVVREEIVPGVARALSPMCRRILAMNPGPKTGLGTNTYMVGIDEIAVIDPGPMDQNHLDAIIGCGGDLIRWILVTNTSDDHAGAAAALASQTGATLMSMGDMDCDVVLKNGQQLVGTEFRLTVKHLPGPSANNIGLMLEEERMLLSGDLIVDGPSVAVPAPDGDMVAYLESLESLKKLRLRRIAPAHGYVIEEPKPAIQAYIDHRLAREAEVLKKLKGKTMRVEELAEAVYGEDLDEELVELAQGTVLAHLIKLRSDGKVKGQKNFTTV